MNTSQNNAAAVAEPSGAHAAETPERTGGRTIHSIEAALKAKLDPAHVKSREQGGSTVQYIEGWHAIEQMNAIFGHLNWSRETLLLREVCRYQNSKGNQVVGYEAKVAVRVTAPDGFTCTTREGSGYGSGIAKDLFSAIESAGKEAETDAMKRAMMTFGNPLGLALYDKSRANVGGNEAKTKAAHPAASKTKEERYAAALAAIERATSYAALNKLAGTTNYKNLLSDLDGTDMKTALMNTVTERFAAFMDEETKAIQGA